MAITTSYTWNITELRNDTSDKFITHASFSITGVAKSDGVAICTVRDTCCTPLSFDTERTGSEKPFADVTEADMIGWIQAGIGTINVNILHRQIDKSLDKIINPPIHRNIRSPLPWE